jgi:hypothetical protein
MLTREEPAVSFARKNDNVVAGLVGVSNILLLVVAGAPRAKTVARIGGTKSPKGIVHGESFEFFVVAEPEQKL